MDELDQKLIAFLQVNARASATDLAKRLGVSRGTIQNRIDRMIDDGRIERFTLQLAPELEESQVSAFTLVRVKVDDGRAVQLALRKITGVLEIATLSGQFDLVVELRARSLRDMDAMLDRIRSIPDVAETQSHIRLSSHRIQ